MIRSCSMVCIFAFMLLALYFSTLTTLFKSSTGLQYVSQLSVDIDTYLLKSECDNSTVCDIIKKIKMFGLSFPLFLGGFHGDRVSMFNMLDDIAGINQDNMIAFGDGVFTPKYDNVLDLVMSPDQLRGPYLGTLKVPSECLGQNTLIFLNTSSKMHHDFRQLLKDAIPALSKRSNLRSYFDNINVDDTYDVVVVRKTLIKTLFYTMFSSIITDDQVSVIMEYLTYGPTCVLGEDFHRLTFNLLLKKVNKIRNTVYDIIYISPTGRNAAELVKNNYQYMDINETIMQMTDGFLFAGLIGTEHLVTHLLNRIHNEHNDNLWEKNTTAFILEHARLDPPVTSVTTLLNNDMHLITLNKNKNITIKARTRNQVGLSTANRDPTIWGGRYHSEKKALIFDPSRENLDRVMSWNGPVSHVKFGSAPRGCPAYNLSLSIAESMVDFFKRQPVLKSETKSETFDANFDKFIESIGFVIWFVACFIWFVDLLIDHIMNKKQGIFTKYYMMYLLSQIGVSVSHLYDNLVLKHVFAILAAQSYFLIFVTYMNINSILLRVWTTLLYIISSLYMASIIILSVRFDINGKDTMNVLLPYYGVGSLCGLITIYDFYTNETDRKNYGLFGAIMGLIDMPLSYIPVYGTFISRVFDSIFYVPNIVPLIELMDQNLDRSSFLLKKNKKMKSSNITTSIFIVILVALLSWKVNDFVSLGSPDLEISQLSTANKNFQMMYNVLDSSSKSDSDLNSNPKKIKIPSWEKKLDRKVVYGNITVPYEDEDITVSWIERSITELYFDEIFANKYLFPLTDSSNTWYNLSDAKKAISIALSSKYNKDPVFYMKTTDDVTSDEIIERLVFAGLGVMEVELIMEVDSNNTDRYMSSYMWMSELEVRPGFQKYGAIAYFNRSQKLTKIQIADRFIRPGDNDWEYAKWVWKCSMLTGITLKNHLVEIHLLYANVLTTISREYLPRDHPMRRLIKPFNYRTVYINYHASHTLTTEYGMLHRATALSQKGLNDAFSYLFSTIRYSPFPERFKQPIIQELGNDYPYGFDGTDFYNIVSKFVGRYVNEYYPNNTVTMDPYLLEAWKNVRVLNNSRIPELSSNNNFINMITNYIIYVTAIHKIVGDVNVYLQDPSFMASKIRPNVTVADVETSAYQILIAKSTTTNTPRLMNDFTHLLLDDSHHDSTIEIFRDFQKDLKILEGVINKRNENRKWKFNGFNPKFMASSVSS